MNTYAIGLGAGVLSVGLDAILPIVFQEGEFEIFHFLFILSIIFILITTIYMFIFQKTDFTTLYKQLLKKSNDVSILFFGGLRYLKYVLYTFGALNVNVGLYSALVSFELTMYSIYSHITSDTFPNVIELAGYSTVVLFLTIISYLFISEKNTNLEKRTLFYAILAITVAMGADFIDSDYFSKIDKNPFEDIELSSLAMFFISSCVVLYRWFFVKGSSSSFAKMFDISKLVYIIGVAIFICDYIPSLLEFTTFDLLNTETIMCLFILQVVVGFLLNRFYYGLEFSGILIWSILGLIAGSFSIIIGKIRSSDKTNYNSIKYIRNNRAFDGVSSMNVLSNLQHVNH